MVKLGSHHHCRPNHLDTPLLSSVYIKLCTPEMMNMLLLYIIVLWCAGSYWVNTEGVSHLSSFKFNSFHAGTCNCYFMSIL